MMAYSGSMLMVVAPSGAGKSSLVNALLKDDSSLMLSVSFTTRSPRPGEENGREYHFVSQEEFYRRKNDGDLLEWALVHSNYYGTSKSWLEAQVKEGRDVILEIDWQGAQQIKRLIPEAIWVFILPPSLGILEDRLRNRGQDDEETIQRRLNAANQEISHISESDYCIVNDDFDTALTQLRQITMASRLKTQNQLSRYSTLVHSFQANK